MKQNHIYLGDCRKVMLRWPEGCVQACITSPPYWGLRDYSLDPLVWDGDSECEHEWDIDAPPRRNRSSEDIKDISSKEATKTASASDAKPSQFCQKCGSWRGALGLEPTPELYTDHLVQIFREVKRLLRKDGTCWLNIADSYWGGKGRSGYELPHEAEERRAKGETMQHSYNVPGYMDMRPSDGRHHTIKPKDMVLIPFRLALALQADGWWLRSDIIWHKPNCMPSSVRDRPTTDFEHVFLLAKSKKYYYDQDAIREPYTEPLNRWGGDSIKEETPKHSKYLDMQKVGASSAMRAGRAIRPNAAGRNKRCVWTLPTKSFPGAHFATFPPALIEPMILAGSAKKACPICGAAWTRVVEKLNFGRADTKSQQQDGIHKRSGARSLATKRQAYRAMGYESPPAPNTLRFQPSCDCPDNDGSGRSIVLDPFAGSGTTCAVALQHGRDYIGIEQNPEYIELAEKRIEDTQYLIDF